MLTEQCILSQFIPANIIYHVDLTLSARQTTTTRCIL